MVDQGAVLGGVEVLDADELLGLVDARLGGGDGLVLLVVLEVVLGLGGVAGLTERLQLRHGLHSDHLLGEPGEGAVSVGRLLRAAGDDQRRPGLVDEDVVDLVDDPEDVVALDAFLERGSHVVAEVVEAELGVGAVGDARAVHLAALGRGHLRLDHADVHAERVEDWRHPQRVAARQVVVDGDDVDRLAGERVEEDRGSRGEGLALAGLHLGDRAVVEDHGADQLDVVVALTQRPLAGLARKRKRLGHQRLERLAVPAALAKARRLRCGARQSSRSSISGSISLMRATVCSNCLSFLPSPTRRALSINPLPGIHL